MENLNRGFVAVSLESGTPVSGRLLGHEPHDIGFNVCKGGTKLNSTPTTDAICYQDNAGGGGKYTVKTVTDNMEGPSCETGGRLKE